MKQFRESAFAAACAVTLCMPCLAQVRPVTILEIDMENVVNYVDDLADPSRKATSPAVSPVAANLIWAYKMNLTQGGIVAVNGKPAKGLFVQQYGTRVLAATQFTPGVSIADLGGGCQLQAGFMILHPDGTPIGTIMATGTTAMGPPPGAPTSATAFNFAVVGGTGAYLGVQGQTSRVRATGVRTASMIEDPAYRRLNGGGTQRFVVHLIPMNPPEVMITPQGPAIFHGEDFSPVTAEKPARAGEWLVMRATNLGPTRPAVDPGQPFPALEPGKAALVNSPVEVNIGGQSAETATAIGWPQQTNAYRVDFRVPRERGAGCCLGRGSRGEVSRAMTRQLPRSRVVPRRSRLGVPTHSFLAWVGHSPG